MKLSHLTIIALLSVNLLAQEGAQPILYKQAQDLYNARGYQEAYRLFEKLGIQAPQSADIHFYTGLCALELKLYDDAVAAFDRVLILNPNHTRTHLELARLHFELQQFQQAQNELDIVLKDQLPDNVKDTALAFKSKIDERLSRHTFGGALIIGGGYDSNVNNDIGGKEFIIPSLNIPINGNEKISDKHMLSTMVLSHTYDFGEKGDWSLEDSLVAYSNLYSKSSTNNLVLFSLTAAPVWSENNYKLSFPINYDRIYMDGKGYAYNIGSTAKATYLIDPTSQIEGGYTYQKSFYNDNTLDAIGDILFISYKKALGEDPILLSLKGSYTNNAEVESVRTDVANIVWSYGVELAKEFKNGFKTSIGYTASLTDYDDVDTLFGTKRSDTKDQYTLGVGYNLQHNLTLNANLTYTKNSSNHDPFNYDKTAALLSAILTF